MVFMVLVDMLFICDMPALMPLEVMPMPEFMVLVSAIVFGAMFPICCVSSACMARGRAQAQKARDH